MSKRIGGLAILALLSSAVACGSPSSTAPAPSPDGQVIRGTIALAAYATDNPVVVARTADGRSFFAPVFTDGSFALSVPAGAVVRLTLANSTRSGGYVAISRVLWPGASAVWARLDGVTPSIALGNVAPSSIAAATLRPMDHGSSDGSGDSSGESGSSGSSGGSDDASKCNEGSGQLHQCGTAAPGRADLPYDVRPALGSTFQLDDAFLAKGPLPASIVSVTMDGGSWRLTELQNDTPFVITQADCDHQGNRDVGRDRVFITWTNADGSQATDHLDLRYCDGSGSTATSSGGGSSGGSASSGSSDDGDGPDDCENDGAPVCASSGESDSHCDGHGGGMSADDDDHGDDDATCTGSAPGSDAGAPGTTGSTGADAGANPPANPPTGGGAGGTGGTGGVTTGGAGAGQIGDACTVNADCGLGLECFASRCATPIK